MIIDDVARDMEVLFRGASSEVLERVMDEVNDGSQQELHTLRLEFFARMRRKRKTWTEIQAFWTLLGLDC